MIQCHICLCHCLIFQIKGVNFITIRQIIVHGHFPVFEFGGYYTLFLRIRPFEIDFNIAIISGGDATSCTRLYMLCDYLLPPSDDGRQDSLSLQDLAIVLEKSMKCIEWGVIIIGRACLWDYVIASSASVKEHPVGVASCKRL